MTCCTSMAVCCLLVIAVMSGVALGYNYSLAEYIDLKETNVTVYLKRGVFDDEIADDLQFRRSGGQAIDESVNDNNIKNVPSGLSGRRFQNQNENSMNMEEDNRQFEGSLQMLSTDNYGLHTFAPTEPNVNQMTDFRRFQGTFRHSDVVTYETPTIEIDGSTIPDATTTEVIVDKAKWVDQPATAENVYHGVRMHINNNKNMYSGRKSLNEENGAALLQNPPNIPSYNKFEIGKLKEMDMKGKRIEYTDYESPQSHQLAVPPSDIGDPRNWMHRIAGLSKEDLLRRGYLDSDNKLPKPYTPKSRNLEASFSRSTPGRLTPTTTLSSRTRDDMDKNLVEIQSTFYPNGHRLNEGSRYEMKSSTDEYIDEDSMNIPLRRRRNVR